jgi:hypothetical protein
MEKQNFEPKVWVASASYHLNNNKLLLIVSLFEGERKKKMTFIYLSYK